MVRRMETSMKKILITLLTLAALVAAADAHPGVACHFHGAIYHCH
jgi:hypothetical protein